MAYEAILPPIEVPEKVADLGDVLLYVGHIYRDCKAPWEVGHEVVVPVPDRGTRCPCTQGFEHALVVKVSPLGLNTQLEVWVKSWHIDHPGHPLMHTDYRILNKDDLEVDHGR